MSTRRQVLGKTLLGFGSYAMAPLLSCKKAQAPAPAAAKGAAPGAPPKPRALTAAQLATLGAACERILPRDQDPGATDLECAAYIARALQEEDVYVQFGKLVAGGLTALDRQARTRWKKAFHEGAVEEQDALLAAWQQSRFSGESGFFEVLHTLTLEGAFGDPSHGGNRDGQGYQLIGFVPPPPSPGNHLIHLKGRQ